MSATSAKSDQINIYGYTPTFPGALVFSIVFLLLSIVHLVLTFLSRRWVTILFFVFGITEFIGWIGRSISAKDPSLLNPFLVQIVTLIIAPTFYSAALYALFAVVINILGRRHSLISPRLYIIIFLVIDIISLVVQAIGGANASLALQHHKDTTAGGHIMLAGIILQLASMVFFSGFAIVYLSRVYRDPEIFIGRQMHRLILGLSLGSMCILIRCVYRTIELAEGWQGNLITHEGYFIGLDAAPMVIALIVFLVCHPYFTLPKLKTSERLIDSGQSSGSSGKSSTKEEDLSV